MSYNGWKNRETWLVCLWLGDLFDDAVNDGEEISPDYVEQIVEEMTSALLESPDASGFLTDLLNGALSQIDYREIAQHYKEIAA